MLVCTKCKKKIKRCKRMRVNKPFVCAECKYELKHKARIIRLLKYRSGELIRKTKNRVPIFKAIDSSGKYKETTVLQKYQCEGYKHFKNGNIKRCTNIVKMTRFIRVGEEILCNKCKKLKNKTIRRFR